MHLLRVIIVIMQMVYHYANAAHDSLISGVAVCRRCCRPAAVDETSFSGAEM